MVAMSRPYLSVVVAARNDDHGGNLLHRMQVFINALIGQINRHQLPAELLLVEWNPPADRPSLADTLQWPSDLGLCRVRVIEVPAEVHRRCRHSEALPLYQMMAKNAGIRRAEGEFILATNLDIVFSEELFRFLAERRLERGKMYRIDRYDVAADLPLDATVDQQLAYCQTHLLRINAREGTFRAAPGGLRLPAAADVVSADSGIFLGPGWFQPEQHSLRVFRWASDDAQLVALPPAADARSLLMDLEPGPGTAHKPFELEVYDASGEQLGRVSVEGRSVVRLQLRFQAGERQTFRLRVIGGGRRIPADPRTLNFRMWWCGWSSETTAGRALRVERGPAAMPQRVRRMAAMAGRAAAGVALVYQAVRFRRSGRIGLPLRPQWLEGLQPRVEASGISIAVGRRAPAEDPIASPAFLHTNGCGDFTLMAREHWFDLRGYPEFDMFSMNLDSVLCFAAHYGGAREEVLGEPMRIYHIEHASGWTPEGQARLFERLAEKGVAWLDNQEVMGWAAQMQRWNTTMIFNRENWGLADLELSEQRPRGAASSSLQDIHAR